MSPLLFVGKISAKGSAITGIDTNFTTDVEVGGSIMIPSVDMPCKVILNDLHRLLKIEQFFQKDFILNHDNYYTNTPLRKENLPSHQYPCWISS